MLKQIHQNKTNILEVKRVTKQIERERKNYCFSLIKDGSVNMKKSHLYYSQLKLHMIIV